MCFFCGNDFLPHLPSLSIHEGALDMLLDMYQRVLPTLGGYMTESGVVRVFLSFLSLYLYAAVVRFLWQRSPVEDGVSCRRKGADGYVRRYR